MELNRLGTGTWQAQAWLAHPGGTTLTPQQSCFPLANDRLSGLTTTYGPHLKQPVRNKEKQS